MTYKETVMLKELFSKYCRGEINKGYCNDGDCEFCAVNKAYDMIFHSSNEDEEEEEEDY